MSAFIIQKSPFNQISFVPEDYPGTARYHTAHPGTDWWVNTLPKGVIRPDCPYPAEKSDPQQLQFHIDSTNAGVALYLIDRRGTILHTFTPATTVAVTGNTWTQGTATVPLTTYHYRFTFAQVSGLKDGRYWMRLRVDKGGGEYTYEITEAIVIKVSHPGTIRISGYNNTNSDHTVFSQANAVFTRRVKGAVVKYTPVSTDTSFRDQDDIVTKLDSRPGQTCTLIVDGGYGLPDYAQDQINHLLSADVFKINGRQFVKEESAKWEEIGDDPVWPLRAMSIVLKTANPMAHLTTVLGGTLDLFTLPVSYPWALAALKIGESGTPEYNLIPAGPRIMTGAGSVTTLINDLNTIGAALGLTGVFSQGSGKVKYANGAAEIFDTVLASVLTSYFDLFVSPLTASYPFSIQHQFARLVVAWGDGVVDSYASLSSLATETHTYATVGTGYDILVFGTAKTINISDPALQDITGTMPATLQSLSLRATAGHGPTYFDFAILSACAPVLQSLGVSQGQLNDYSNAINTMNFPVLRFVNFSKNELDQTLVSNLVQQIKNKVIVSGVYGGSLFVNAQTPPTTLNVTGISAKGLLGNTYGWQVTV